MNEQNQPPLGVAVDRTVGRWYSVTRDGLACLCLDEANARDTTCIRCGRQWQDGEWMPLAFSRAARLESVERARAYWRSMPPRSANHFGLDAYSGAPSVLVAYGDNNAAALERSGLPGKLLHNAEFSGGPLGISTTKDGRGPSAGTQG